MNNKRAIYTVFSSLSWLIMMVCVLVFWGPVKKIIELRNERTSAHATALTLDKKLSTWHREKRDIPALVQAVTQQSPDAGNIPVVFAGLFSFFLFSTKRAVSEWQHPAVAVSPALPLYLSTGRLQV